jgi:2-oxoglutarate dehydrogenase complex dehydrogenase (E1) component-like enzyme
MRVGTLMALLLLAALAPACKSRRPVAVDTSEAGEIPREVALQKLRELLPTAEYLYCTAPKETLKGSEVRGLSVQSSQIQIDHGRGKRLSLTYADIAIVNLEQVGKYYTARVYTAADAERELFGFQWRQEDPAKRAVELLASLKKK